MTNFGVRVDEVRKKSVIRILKVMYMSVNVRTKKAEVDVDSPLPNVVIDLGICSYIYFISNP